MKKQILALSIFGITIGAQAQVTNASNGNVGIGTSNPDAKLRIEGSNSLARFKTEDNGYFEIQATRSTTQSLPTNLKLSAQNHIILDPNANGTSGNVGIGTSNPNTVLHIKKSQSGWLQEIAGTAGSEGKFVGLKLLSGYAGETGKWTGISAIAESTHSNRTGLGLYTGKSERLRIDHDGNVGIGTSDPNTVLHIRKNQAGWLQEIAGTAPDQNRFVGLKLLAGYAGETGKWVGIAAMPESAHSNHTGLGLHTGHTERLRIQYNGNVGIGTTTPDAKLTVAGNIHSREVKVTVNAGADFVFDEAYELPSLTEVEDFVTQNKHLPEIASEKEMQENGLQLAEMNIKLLQKIEELTLYTIQQQKEIDRLQILESKFAQLQNKILKLEHQHK